MPDTAIRNEIIANATSIVVKVGTNAITDAGGRLDTGVVSALARQIARLMKSGCSVTLVASGAIGAGLAELDLPERPKTLPLLQACAAVGQSQLMRAFQNAFKRHGVRVAQVLVTRDSFENRTRYLNIRNTLGALADYNVLPIINENDAVSVDEIRFGDNDVIAALVTNMMRAELLVLLSVIDGVMKDGRVLDMIEQVDKDALALADDRKSRLGSGGMASKIAAAGLVTKAGETAVIANARMKDVLTRLKSGEKIGTVLFPARQKLSSRRRWIGAASRPQGKLTLDAGAVRAITQRGKSLLPSGITEVIGKFQKGATVSLIDADGTSVARGLSNYSADQVRRIKGLRTSQVARTLGDKPYDEVVHRDNMVLL
ncbi:MAG: glutamate 5-kinase [Phycisphaerae bacterium]